MGWWRRCYVEVLLIHFMWTRLGSVRLSLTRLGVVQYRRHDIPPSCAPEFDTRSTKSREPFPADTSSWHHHDDVMMMSYEDFSCEV
ncbi:hypothetical protein Hanom_Chr17g01570131 [Helianthus anomalus]